MKVIVIPIVLSLFLLIFFMFLVWAAGSRHPRKMIKEGSIKEYSGAFTKQIEAGETLRIMTYNLGYASGLKNNKGSVLSRKEIMDNLERITKSIKMTRPHILALQEVDFSSRRSHYINEMEYIAKALGFAHAAYAITWDKRYVPFPFTLSISKHFGRVESGQVVLSTYPIVYHRTYFFEKPASNTFIYNLFYLDRVAQHVRINMPKRGLIDVYNVHLEAFDRETRQNQARRLVTILKDNDFQEGFVVGDFNALPPDAGKTAGFPDEPDADMKDDDTIETILRCEDIREALMGSYEGNPFTFPSYAPNRRLDYIFYSLGFMMKDGRVVDDAGEGSDHLPVTAEFETVDDN